MLQHSCRCINEAHVGQMWGDMDASEPKWSEEEEEEEEWSDEGDGSPPEPSMSAEQRARERELNKLDCAGQMQCSFAYDSLAARDDYLRPVLLCALRRGGPLPPTGTRGLRAGGGLGGSVGPRARRTRRLPPPLPRRRAHAAPGLQLRPAG